MRIKKQIKKKDENGNYIVNDNSIFEYITVDNVCDIIAKHSELTPEQVRYVFQKYDEILDYSYKKKALVALGKRGYFTFNLVKGKKAGTKVNVMVDDYEATEKYGLTKKNTTRKKSGCKILEKDKPSYMRPCFVVHKSKQDLCKELTIENINDIYDNITGK